MKLKPCPFCGGEAEVEREGTPRRSCIVRCTECHCTLESNENGFGHDWNQREQLECESIIRYLEQQATDWEDHDLKVSRTWSKAARHVRERRDIAPEDLVRVNEPPRSGFAEAHTDGLLWDPTESQKMASAVNER